MVKKAENKIDIFDLAEKNAPYLTDTFQSLLDSTDKKNPDTLKTFTTRIRDEWNLSINMKEKALNDFLHAGQYKNIYEQKIREVDERIKKGEVDASEKEMKLEESLRSHLKKYYESRMTFDSGLKAGEKIKYAALNIGGIGISRFAPLCMIIKREDAEDFTALAFIKRDSILHYVHQGRVDFDKLRKDVSNKECLPFLAAIKHKDEIETIPPEKWHSMLCCDADYIEAVTIDDILNSHVRSVRVARAYFNGIFKVTMLKKYDSQLTDDEQLRLQAFLLIMDTLKKRGIELEVIDEH